ncbi:glycosyltransferase family 4 protein [Noviherbaspirillum autotrophicum]|nr:glycosyltransferase family 4 protein [Noviherbaspirillum autotrophicum]
MLRIALVTNTPPPYRVPVFHRLGNMPDITFQAIFCARREPNRQWDLPPLDFDHVFLRERFVTVNGRYIHNNPDVVSALQGFGPDVVITDGFNPTHLYAFSYAWIKRLPHLAMTDGTDISEQGLSRLHKAVRRFIYARSSAFMPASAGGQRHYENYGIPAERCFTSCLCIDNKAFSPRPDQQKCFDFIFSGRIEEVKNPQFAIRVAAETARRLGRKVSILFAGSGSLQESVRAAASASADLVDATFHGFAAQRELPGLYRSSRLFLFPTLWDPWGVVANEACAAGLPVLVSPAAGVCGELVRDGENGFVCPLNVDVWAEKAALLLSRQDLWDEFSRRSLHLVGEYTYDNAADGIAQACRFSLSVGEPVKIKMPV